MADRISIDVILKSEQLKKMMEDVGRMAGAGPGAAAGQAGAAAGGGRGGGVASAMMGEEGKRTEMMGKGLGQIAKQLPGAGVFGDMAGAFKAGGIVGVGMAGIAGILGFVKQIVESSKVFQSIAGSFFKIFGAMADVFLLPFLPLAMKGMQMLLKNMPMIAEWGDKAAGWLENLISNIKGTGWINAIWVEIGPSILSGLSALLSFIPGVSQKGYKAVGEPGKERIVQKTDAEMEAESEAKKRQQERATWQDTMTMQGTMFGFKIDDAIRTALNAGIDLANTRQQVQGAIIGRDLGPGIQFRFENQEGGPGQGNQWVSARGGTQKEPLQRRDLGGIVEGGSGKGVPTMLHGGELVIPRSNVQSIKGISNGVLDILAGTDGQLQALEADVNNYWMESKRDRQDPQSDFMKFKLEVIGEDLPNTILGIGSIYRNIGDMTRNIAAQTKGLGAGWTGIKPMTPAEIAAGLGDNDAPGGGGFAGDIQTKSNTYFAAAAAAVEKYGVPAWTPGDGDPEGRGIVDNTNLISGTGQYRNATGPTSLRDLHKSKNLGGTGVVDVLKELGQTPKQIDEIILEIEKTSDSEKTYGTKSAPNIRSANYQDTHLAGVFDIVDASDQTDSQKREMYEVLMSSGAADQNLTKARQTPMQKYIQDTLSAERIERMQPGYVAKISSQGSGFAPDSTDPDEGELSYWDAIRRDRAAYQAKLAKAAETDRLAQSLAIEQAKIAALYGPEGGINDQGEFVHGTFLNKETGRMLTLEDVGMNQATYMMTELAAPEATAETTVDAETKALEDMIGAQVRKINSYQPLITAAWQLSNQGLEGGKTGIQRGTEAQRLIKERSQQEERLTRMWNQHGQDRLPYSLQEFQTRFQSGGIVPGDIGEPQMVVAHGGETVSPIGMTGGRQGHTSNRVMNISINNASSVRDILRDLNDMESMDDASFFNSVS